MACMRNMETKVCVKRLDNEYHWETSQVLTALQFVAFLPVGGGGHTDVHYVVAWRLIVCRSVSYLFL